MTTKIEITKEAIDTLNKLSPDNAAPGGFGKTALPVMIEAHYSQGKWSDFKLVPFKNLDISPMAKVFHYGQEIFEGMKAYYVDEVGPLLFRPHLNAVRFNRSADRLCMPHVPEDTFIEAVKTISHVTKNFIPTGAGTSLYLRPVMFGTEASFGIKPSEDYVFLILVSPTQNYFSKPSIDVMIEREYARAFEGGIGFAKTGGNYAGSLKSADKCKTLKCETSLWLDGHDRDFIEEMSGMNFFAVIDGNLHTPLLTQTILEGITRKSILELCADKGIKVIERKMSLTELIENIKSGHCTEAFACGTAAVITPIEALVEDQASKNAGTKYSFKYPHGKLSISLKEILTGIQEGRIADPYGWVTPTGNTTSNISTNKDLFTTIVN